MSDEVVGWYVEGGDWSGPRFWTCEETADSVAMHSGGTVVPLVRKGAPRGVVVDAAHRDAVKRAMELAQENSFPMLAKELASLLDAIGAAKGGEA